MRRRTAAASLSTAVLALTAALLPATSASAAPADKAAVLSSWTQTGAAGQTAFLAARADQGTWSAYSFDWSTDYCTTSPDNPFGFPFANACVRHDFGYRNYKAAGSFDANKSRVDDAFYADLKRACAVYSGVKKVSCDATAWTYYQAVDKLG
ncbi:phospholipase [Streptomyces sp. NPDC057199]|uniref:phospholipase n=1 Tax=Streptomyces sp. NPDC057199 TaxID=3346047 RepID=UPI00363EE715